MAHFPGKFQSFCFSNFISDLIFKLYRQHFLIPPSLIYVSQVQNLRRVNCPADDRILHCLLFIMWLWCLSWHWHKSLPWSYQCLPNSPSAEYVTLIYKFYQNEQSKGRSRKLGTAQGEFYSMTFLCYCFIKGDSFSHTRCYMF